MSAKRPAGTWPATAAGEAGGAGQSSKLREVAKQPWQHVALVVLLFTIVVLAMAHVATNRPSGAHHGISGSHGSQQRFATAGLRAAGDDASSIDAADLAASSLVGGGGARRSAASSDAAGALAGTVGSGELVDSLAYLEKAVGAVYTKLEGVHGAVVNSQQAAALQALSEQQEALLKGQKVLLERMQHAAAAAAAAAASGGSSGASSTAAGAAAAAGGAAPAAPATKVVVVRPPRNAVIGLANNIEFKLLYRFVRSLRQAAPVDTTACVLVTDADIEGNEDLKWLVR